MTSMSAKRRHVLRSGQTRNHECHWPSCKRQVPPAMWGCREHWSALPLALRRRIWSAYVIGQEERGDPSVEYLVVAEDVQEWIRSRSCPKCKAGEREAPHECPYQVEINDNRRHCHCCTTCREACSDDV